MVLISIRNTSGPIAGAQRPIPRKPLAPVCHSGCGCEPTVVALNVAAMHPCGDVPFAVTHSCGGPLLSCYPSVPGVALLEAVPTLVGRH